MTKKNVTARLRKTLPRLMKEKAWNQSQLAEAADVSAQRVSDWKRGNNLPDADNLRSLASGTGVSLDWLLVTDDVPMMWADHTATPGALAQALVKYILDDYKNGRRGIEPATEEALLEVVGGYPITGEQGGRDGVRFQLKDEAPPGSVSVDLRVPGLPRNVEYKGVVPGPQCRAFLGAVVTWVMTTAKRVAKARTNPDPEVRSELAALARQLKPDLVPLPVPKQSHGSTRAWSRGSR